MNPDSRSMSVESELPSTAGQHHHRGPGDPGDCFACAASERLASIQAELAETRTERDEARAQEKLAWEKFDHYGFETSYGDMRRVVEYAANMPDSEDMPEWARELRHHARQALQRSASNQEEA